MKRSLIVKGNFIFTKESGKFEIFKDSFLVARDGRVEAIHPQLPESYKGCEILDYGDRIVIPGFVDLHLHAAQYLQCGIGMTKTLLDWLNDYTFDLERQFQDREFARAVYSEFAAKLAAHGTLRASVFASSSTQGTEELFEALKAQGIGAYVGKVNMDRNAPDFILEDTAASIDGTRYLIEKYGDDPLVKPIITPRFAPTSTDALLKSLGELAVSKDLPVQSHLNENKDEIDWVQSLFPGSRHYSDVYDRHNLFGQTPTIMAHAIYSNDDEVALAWKNKVFLCHCPDSNINVRSGIMPVRRYLKMGMNLGLGSDIAGGHRIGMNDAIVRAIQLSKLRSMEVKGEKPLTVSEAFYLGTKGGGRFFGKTGSFEPGYWFDALVIEESPFVRERYGLEDRLEKFLYTGDDRHISDRFVQGRKL
ncbi:MAG: amidohydrolase family protein [Desulfobacteraceae bacterium]|nr:amidohydrolase family protein [Desulfobacteraceae bacterium]